MADRVLPGPANDGSVPRETACVHTRKIFDSCRDKDCIEDLRVFLTGCSQQYIENALSIRPRSAELMYVDINVDEITFNRGFYTVDVKYFYKIRGTVFPGGHDITGLAIFDKRVILFGSEGGAKTFSSDKIGLCPAHVQNTSLPTAVIEAVDPIALNMKIVDPSHCPSMDNEICDIPPFITASFGEELHMNGNCKRVYVTLGQFSIIRLERDSQLNIPSFDYCIPQKECAGACEDDPCTLFGKIRFPIEEFFPPDNCSFPEDYKGALNGL